MRFPALQIPGHCWCCLRCSPKPWPGGCMWTVHLHPYIYSPSCVTAISFSAAVTSNCSYLCSSFSDTHLWSSCRQTSAFVPFSIPPGERAKVIRPLPPARKRHLPLHHWAKLSRFSIVQAFMCYMYRASVTLKQDDPEIRSLCSDLHGPGVHILQLPHREVHAALYCYPFQ